MQVLLVEHNLHLARAIIRGLEEEEIDVHLARDDSEGDARGRTIAYGAVVVDWRVPRQGGAALVRSWREDGVRTPVIMLMPSASIPDLVEGCKAGADDFLPLPFSFVDLLARLRALRPEYRKKARRMSLGKTARAAARMVPV